LVAEVEALTNPWWSLAGPVVGALGALGLYLSSRRGQDKTGEGGFRADLMKRIDQLEAGQRKDAETIEKQDARIDELLTENRGLREQVWQLTRRVGDLDGKGAGQ
jgi:hypothetical protein